MIGPRARIIAGPRVGLAAGLPLDQLARRGGLAVSRDATSGIYVPSSGAQWDTLLSAISSGIARPQHLWLCQEAGGSLADSIGDGIGARDLAAAGSPSYEKAIAGWSRRAVGGPGSATAANFSNATMASSATTSYAVLAIAVSAQPTVLRNVVGLGSPVVQQPATAKIRLRLGGSVVDSTDDHAGAVHAYLAVYDVTAARLLLYTDLNKLSATYAASTGSTLTITCSSTGDATSCDVLYACAWEGAAAEAITDAEAKTLLTGMGWSPPWS